MLGSTQPVSLSLYNRDTGLQSKVIRHCHTPSQNKMALVENNRLRLRVFRFYILGHFHSGFSELSSLAHLVYFKLWLDIISEYVSSFVTTI